ncbi:D-2-hydroxyacid dehydrogenase [Aestuariimicrobium soli]|uniref:D-2-hydroxyacid dehydrogenase n=1 Tax=Aestuariimicrobium soli TaxID=2035834 RepID=UPI003EB8F58B
MADLPSPRLVVSGYHLTDDERAALLALEPRTLVVDTWDDITAPLDEVTGVAGPLGRPLDALPRLTWQHSWAAGPDSYVNDDLRTSGVVLTSAVGNGAVPLAEHAMLLMLMLNRDALRWVDNQRAHRWERFSHGELAGLTLGIVGLGHSGADLARKAKAFHMRVIATRRRPELSGDVDEVRGADQLPWLLAESDVVVVTAPLTDETRCMFGVEQFRAMKPTATWICFSRGGIADDDALLQALREGWIAGAGIDAHGVEPLPADSPFWDAPNTIITPHNGATSHQTPRRGVEIFLENVRRHVAGEALVNIVDLDAGY